MVEFFGLGDCVGALRTRDGRTLWSCDAALPALDSGVIAYMAQLHRDHGCTVLEAREQCGDLLLRNRELRNTPGGYWILDPSGDGIPHARVLRWRREEVESLSAFSDGFAQLALPFRLYPDWGQLHCRMTQAPLRSLLEELYAAQEADPDGPPEIPGRRLRPMGPGDSLRKGRIVYEHPASGHPCGKHPL